MSRLIALVEGQTEETFFQALLYPSLDCYGEKLGPVKLDPSGVQQGRSARGGHAHRFGVIERDLKKLLGGRFDVVTTMFDLYHLPTDFPGMPEAQRIPNEIRRAEHLEAALYEHFGSPPQLVPNLVVQEFEALLFASPTVLEDTVYLNREVAREMSAVARSFATPEQINDENPPGVRLSKSSERHGTRYQKPLQGNLIALEVGLEAMLERCEHFASWVSKLKQRGVPEP